MKREAKYNAKTKTGEYSNFFRHREVAADASFKNHSTKAHKQNLAAKPRDAYDTLSGRN